MKVVHYNPRSKNIENILLSNKDCKWFHYPHKELDKGKSLINLARTEQQAYNDLIFLANNGFYVYDVKNNNTVTSFVQHNTVSETWNRVSSGEYLIDDGIVYSFTKPLINYDILNLLVIFSSISSDMYQPYLSRYFEQNFSSIQKHIAPNTAILRIADIGGITGAYYLDTYYLKNNESKIQKLIKKISQSIDASKTVLFGISKGGSGALYHALLGEYDFLAVDPIVDDHFYLTKCNDLHFVKNIFLQEKSIKFKNIIENINFPESNIGSVICSPYSEQYNYISRLLFEKCSRNFSFFVNNNPKITKHPEVAPNSVPMMTNILNNILHGIYIEKKIYNFV